MADYIRWPGKSGKLCDYWFISDPTAQGILAVAGNYAFVRRVEDGSFLPLYFGEAVDLQNRVPGHERWNDALRAGMTHVMAHKTDGGEQTRRGEEADLIARWNPPLNIQGRTDTPKVSAR